jgi:hypothetical protein
MGALNLAEYQERVLLEVGNVAVASAINKAPNTLIRENPDLFPEHQNNTWTTGPTVVGDNLIPLPSNLNVLQKVTCSRDAVPSGSPASIWTLIQEYPLGLVATHTIGLIAKPTTITGYPTMCDRKSNNLIYNPTTQTGFTTYFRFYGIAGEVPLVAPGDTFRMDEYWDDILIQIAAASTLKSMRHYDAAGEIMEDVRGALARMGGVVAKERASRPVRIRHAGMPRG